MATTPETAEPTADRAAARRPAAPRKVTRHRGEGQWGMGHFTP